MNAYTLFAILILIASLLLILVIMVQNPKGGGLSSSFGGGGQMLGGVKQTNDFLDKSTWTLAAALVGFILLSNFVIPRHTVNVQEQSEINSILDNAPQVNVPAPATADPTNKENTDESN